LKLLPEVDVTVTEVHPDRLGRGVPPGGPLRVGLAEDPQPQGAWGRLVGLHPLGELGGVVLAGRHVIGQRAHRSDPVAAAKLAKDLFPLEAFNSDEISVRRGYDEDVPTGRTRVAVVCPTDEPAV